MGYHYVHPDLAADRKLDPRAPMPFDGPMDGHEPGQPIHYDLHAWVWKHNPSGTFAQYNPDVSCPDAPASGA